MIVSSFSNSDVVAVSAVIIAFCSFAVTVWQGCTTRSHNRKIVKPILVWCKHRNIGAQGTTLHFSVSNVGMGPAIVRERGFKLDGQVFVARNHGDHVHEFITQALGTHIAYVLIRHGLPAIESAILVANEWTVAEIFFPGSGKEEIDRLENKLNVDFELSYESVYGEKGTLTT